MCRWGGGDKRSESVFGRAEGLNMCGFDEKYIRDASTRTGVQGCSSMLRPQGPPAGQRNGTDVATRLFWAFCEHECARC